VLKTVISSKTLAISTDLNCSLPQVAPFGQDILRHNLQ